jgi:hypothetical protein
MAETVSPVARASTLATTIGLGGAEASGTSFDQRDVQPLANAAAIAARITHPGGVQSVMSDRTPEVAEDWDRRRSS